MSTGFYKSMKKMEVSDDGRTTMIKGFCKAKDLQKKGKVDVFFDDDVMKELGVRRVD
ncbi:MAG TPA: hypothetical protein PLT65_04325 [Bacilli bacterium]|nr:hypothetical protein [Bacilli bacterium]